MLQSIKKSKLSIVNVGVQADCKELCQLTQEKEALLKTLEERQQHLKILKKKALEQKFNQLNRKDARLGLELNAGLGLTAALQRIPTNEELQASMNDGRSVSIIQQLVADSVFLNGIDFTVEDEAIIGDSEKYMLHATCGPVEFYVQFIWNTTSHKCSDINVSFCTQSHKQDLASRINTCVRESNLVKLIETISQYSELYIQRENTLKKLSKMEELTGYFKFHEALDYGGFLLKIEDKHTDSKYIKASWSIKYFKARYVMDHSFTIKVISGAEELGQQHENLLIKLIKKEDLTEKEIIEIFTRLTEAFKLWLR